MSSVTLLACVRLRGRACESARGGDPGSAGTGAESAARAQVLPSALPGSGDEDEGSGSEDSEPAIVFSGVDFSLMDAGETTSEPARRRGGLSARRASPEVTPVKRAQQPQVVLLPPPGLSDAIGQAIAGPDGPGEQQIVALPVVDSSTRRGKEEGPQERHNIPTDGWLSGAAGRLCRGREAGDRTGEPAAPTKEDDPAAEAAYREAVAGFVPDPSEGARGMPLLDLGGALAGLDLDGLIERLQNGTCDMGEQDENESIEGWEEALAERKLEAAPPPTVSVGSSPGAPGAEIPQQPSPPQPARSASRPGSARPRSPFMRILQESSDMQTSKRAEEERPKVFLDLTGGVSSRKDEGEDGNETSSSEVEDEFEEWRNLRAALKQKGTTACCASRSNIEPEDSREEPEAGIAYARAAKNKEIQEVGDSPAVDHHSTRTSRNMECGADVGVEVEIVPAKPKPGPEPLIHGISGSRPGSPFMPAGAMGPRELREFLEGSQHFQQLDGPSESSDDESEDSMVAGVAAYGRQPLRAAVHSRQNGVGVTELTSGSEKMSESFQNRNTGARSQFRNEVRSNEEVARAREESDDESEEDKKMALFERETTLMRARRVALWRAAVLRCCAECPIQTFHEETSFLPPVPILEEESFSFTIEFRVRDPAQLSPLACWVLGQEEVGGAAPFCLLGMALVANPDLQTSESLDIYDKRLVCVGHPSRLDKRDGSMRVFLTTLKRTMQQTSLESLDINTVDGCQNIWEMSRTKSGCSELLKPASPLPVVQGLSAERSLEKESEICMTYLSWESVNSAALGLVVGRALEEGLEVAGMRSVCLEAVQKSVAPHLPASGKFLAFALAGRDSIARWKEAVGPNDHTIAAITDPSSLRAKLSLGGDSLVVTAGSKTAHKDFCHFFGGRLDLNGEIEKWKPPSAAEALSLVALHSTVASWVAISLPNHRRGVTYITRSLAEKGFTSDRLVMRSIDAPLKKVSGLSSLPKNVPVLFAKIRKPCLHFYVRMCLSMGQGFYAPGSLSEVAELDKILDSVDAAPAEVQTRKVMRKLAKLKGTEKSLRQIACVAFSGSLLSTPKELSEICGPDEYASKSTNEFLGFKQVEYLKPDQQQLFYCGHGKDEGELLRATQRMALQQRKEMLQKPLILALFRGSGVLDRIKANCRRAITQPVAHQKFAVIGVAEEGKAVQSAVSLLFKDSEIHDDIHGCGAKFFLPFPPKDRVFSLLRSPPVQEVVIVANLNSSGLGKLSRAFHVLHVKGGFHLVASHVQRFPAAGLDGPSGLVLSPSDASVAFFLRGIDGVRRCQDFFEAAGLLGGDLAMAGSIDESNHWRSIVFGQSHAGVLPCEVAGRQGVSLSNLTEFRITSCVSQGLLQTTCLMVGPLNVSGPFWDENDTSVVDGFSSLADIFDLVRREGFRVSNMKLVHVDNTVGKELRKVYTLPRQEKTWSSGCQALALALTRDNAVARLQMALQKRREKSGDEYLTKCMYASSAKASREDLRYFFGGETLHDSAYEIQRCS